MNSKWKICCTHLMPLTLGLTLLGCKANLSGSFSGKFGQKDSDDRSSTNDTTETSIPEENSSGTENDASTPSPPSNTPPVATVAPALLKASGPQEVAPIVVGATTTLTITLTNSSEDSSISEISIAAISAPFTLVPEGTCSDKLPSLTSCTIVIAASAATAGDFADILKITFFDSVATKTVSVPVAIKVTAPPPPAELPKVLPRFSTATQWMDYVSGDGTGNTGCDPVNDTQCTHGGENLMFQLPNQNSCAGLRAVDELDAFSWLCSVEGGKAIFYTRSLKFRKGLKDLLEATSWKSNRLFVYDTGNTMIAQSALHEWWENPVRKLSSIDSTTAAAAISEPTTVPGTIFTVDDPLQITFGYNIDVDRIAVVTLGSSILKFASGAPNNILTASGKLTGTVDSRAIIGAGDHNYLWVEGRIDGSREYNEATVNLVRVKFAKIINLTTINPGGAVYLRDAHSNVLTNIVSSDNGRASVINITTNSSRNVINYVTATNVDDQGIYILGGSNQNIVNNVVLNNGEGSGIYLDAATHNTVNRVTVANFRWYSVFNTAGANFNVITHPLMLNSGSGRGLSVSASTNNRYHNIISAHHTTFGISSANSSDIVYSGYIRLGGNTTNCSVTGGTNPGLASDCSGSAATSVTLSESLLNAFVGQLGIDTLYESVASWTPTHFYSGWGKAAAAQLDDANYRQCNATMSCAEWDWRLKFTDTVAHLANGVFTDDDTCPASVDGNAALTDNQTPPNTFIASAMEVLGDSIGDDDGLCESNESCIYASNAGGYQGEGDYTTRKCVFQNGTVTNVTMFAYPTSGI